MKFRLEIERLARDFRLIQQRVGTDSISKKGKEEETDEGLDIGTLRRRIDEAADRVENRVLVASENGLFLSTSSGPEGLPIVVDGQEVKTILDRIEESRRLARFGKGEDIYLAVRRLREADILLHASISRKGWRWRFVHLHRIWILLYQVTILTIILIIALNVRFNVPSWWPIVATIPSDASIWTVPIATAAFGAMGAVLRSLYWLFAKLQRSEFYDRFVVGHLSAPWIGAILGILVYLVLAGGLTALTGSNSAIRLQTVPNALALAAGFSWEPAMRLLERLANRLTEDGESRVQKEANLVRAQPPPPEGKP